MPATEGPAPLPGPPPPGRPTGVKRLEATGTDAAERQQRIAIAAYYRAERRGFVGGSPEQDWFEAEAEVDGARVGQA